MSIQGQSQVIPGPNAVEAYRNGEQALLDKKPQAALRWFQKSLSQQPNLLAARRGMAICYELMREYPKAAEQYEAILEQEPLFSRLMYYQAGEAFFKSGAPEKALVYFRQFESLQEASIDTFSMNTERELQLETGYLKKISSNIRACEVSLDSVKFINITEVVNMGEGINSKADDYFPFLTNDQNTMFFTRKTDKGDEDLYRSKGGDNEKWSSASPVRMLNTGKDEGMSTMVRDERLMFFTACGREGVLGPCDIWQATFDENGNPSEVLPLSGFANSEKWESQAAISCDGTTLYFASKRPGGLGGTDLWVSTLDENGDWSSPKNLGPKINTELDEEAPFITNDGSVLYFSSTGHPGMGDQDIFMSWKDQNGQWSQPINLGLPVNSPFRELGFFLTADGYTGYFASDRPDDSRGGLDIYSFKLNEQLYSTPITFVEGIVLDSTLDVPVQATVHFEGRQSITTGNDGRFFLCIPAWDTLNVSVEKTYFHPYEAPFIIPDWSNRQYYTIELRLRSTFDLVVPPVAKPDSIKKKPVKKAVVPVVHSHTIFFGFDETQITPDELDGFLAFLRPINGKKAQRVDIIGFSDEIGTETYNLRLSEERAKQIAQVIQENDLEVDHIYMEGRGEIKSDAPQEQKRKVEIRITVVQ
jgi:outer membrane protein OmpA-like peptidoglycan-associated protein